MPTSRRGPTRVAVRIDPDVWREEVERPDARSPARIAAERERRLRERAGVALAQLQRCNELGDDQTRLPGLVKVYVPIVEAAACERPYGVVFSPEPGPMLAFAAIPTSRQHRVWQLYGSSRSRKTASCDFSYAREVPDFQAIRHRPQQRASFGVAKRVWGYKPHRGFESLPLRAASALLAVHGPPRCGRPRGG